MTLRSRAASILAAVLLLVGITVFAVGVAAADTISDAACSGTDLKLDGTCDAAAKQRQATSQTTLNNLIANIVNVFSVIVGIVAVIMIIFAGFRYITAGGDANSISSAKNTIIYAIVGLIVVAMAQTIARFVLNKATS